jgi:hypothetical protein
MAGQPGLFDLDERYAALSRTGDPLERLAAVVDFEIFRADLDAALARSDRSKGGRPPMDAVMMFKVLVLQARLRAGGRADRVPDQGPAQLHALSGHRPVRTSSGRPHDLAVQGTPHQSGGR